MVKKRRTLWASPESKEKVIKIQGKYQEMNGTKISIQEIIDGIIKQVNLDNIEIQKIIEGNIQKGGIKIKFDRRIL